MIGCQWLCLTATETAMIVFRAQRMPLLHGITAAVVGEPRPSPVNGSHRVPDLLAFMLWISAVALAQGSPLTLLHIWVVLPILALALLHSCAVFRFVCPLSPRCMFALLNIGALVADAFRLPRAITNFGFLFVGIGTLARLWALIIGSLACLAPREKTIGMLLALMKLINGPRLLAAGASLLWYNVQVKLLSSLSTLPAVDAARGLRVAYSIPRLAV